MKNKSNIFINDKYWQYNACIAPLLGIDYNEKAMIEGYFYSANIVVGSLIYDDFINEKYKNDVDKITHKNIYSIHLDTLVYPICFNYRHYIELYLKFLIRKIKKILKNKLTKKEEEKMTKHNLSSLYNLLVNSYNKLLQKFKLNKKKEYSILKKYQPLLEQITSTLNNFDNDSLATRYIANQNNKPYFDKHVIVNILELGNKLQEVNEAFSHLDFILNQIEEEHSNLYDQYTI